MIYDEFLSKILEYDSYICCNNDIKLIDSLNKLKDTRAFLWYKCNPENSKSAFDVGFDLVSTSVRFKYLHKNCQLTFEPNRIRITQNMDNKCLAPFLHIAGKSFNNSRFSKDKNITQGQDYKIKSTWLYNNVYSCDFENFFAYDKTLNNKPVGFISIKKIKNEDFRVIDLIAVEKDYRGYGIGHYLVTEAIKFSKSENFGLEVTTQNDNKSAINLYNSMGFVFTGDIELCFHKHLFPAQ